MARSLFSWIHLSDIHFGHGAPSDRYDQKTVLARLRRDLDDARTEGAPRKPDAILVTGDVAFSGGGKDPAEYVDAARWLADMAKQVGLGAGDVFVVPGNHDVNQDKDRDRNTSRLMSGLRDGRDELDTVLADPGDRDLLGKRMGAYLDFASGFAPACLAPGGKGQLFWVHRFHKNGLSVRLAGLNTALLCAKGGDKGKLRLGKQQLHEALGEPPAKGELVMVLTHHPLRAWLDEADARSAEMLVKNDAHVHLSGHVHEAESSEVRGGGARGGTVRIAAGAVHNERQPESWIPAGHGYNWAEVVADDDGRIKLRIRPRQWSDGNADFRLDVGNVPRGAQYAEHPLSIELPKPAPKPAGGFDRSRWPAAHELFYFYASDDEDERKKLHNHLALLWQTGVVTCSSKQSIEAAGGDVLEAIDRATFFLVLLSPSFIASDDFMGPEMTRVYERAAAGSVLFPIFLKPFDLHDNPLWEASPMSRQRPFPFRRADSHWVVEPGVSLDAALKDVAVDLRKAIEERSKA